MSGSRDTETLAAIDLGSNSFHMIVGRLQNDQLQVIDRLREPVRLASGLTDRHKLQPQATQRALGCLERFGQRINELPPENIRAVGTNTLRRIHPDEGFLEQAQKALGHGIEVISGIEEARLVYLGVAHSLPHPGGRRLVVDIGGGSTELIIGEEFQPVRLESLYMGCVEMSQRFFADGSIEKSAMKNAILAARLELQPCKRLFQSTGWSMATGSSGTIRTVRDVVLEMGWSDNGITAESLKKLRSALVEAGSAEALTYASISDDRKPVFAGGVAVLSAVFHALKIDRMLCSSGALREGLLYDLLGRIQQHDIRESTVQSLAQRYHVDLDQASRVEQTAMALVDQAAPQWQLQLGEARQWLHWAAQVHEIGLVIAHNQYHKHGAYLIEHSDLPGFSMRDQRLLSILVRCHRRKFHNLLIEELPESLREKATHLCLLMRLAVLFNRSRSSRNFPKLHLSVSDDLLRLQLDREWLDEHPLTQADLKLEKKHLKGTGIKLEFQ